MTTAVQPSAATVLDDAGIDAYLADANAWRSSASTALLELDDQAKVAHVDDAAADVALAFSIWRGAGVRIDEATATRGQGRMSAGDRAAVQALVWAPLADDAGSPIAANLPEARTLVDALVTRARTALAGQSQQLTTITGLLAPITERVDQAAANAKALGEMVRQVEVLAQRLDRLGPSTPEATVRSEVGAIEQALAPIERDLLSLARAKSTLTDDVAALPGRVQAAEELEATTREIAARCQEKIAGPPNLAVPDVSVIGPPPSLDEIGSLEWRAGRAAVDAYVSKLSKVERALGVAHDRYAAPLQRRDDLRGLLDGYRAMAASRGLGEQAEASSAFDAARAALYTAPCDLAEAARLVDVYQRVVNASTPTPEDRT